MARNQDITAGEVFELCSTYMSEKNVDFVKRAYDYANKAHEGQFRLSGEPYIIHPIQVAGILAQLKMDADTVATGFLHDVVEDTEVSLEEIEAEFSSAVAFLVDGVTKLGQIKFQSKQEELAENHRKMLLAMSRDIRVIIVKLADRLHNMRTMKYQKPAKQIEKSEEALEIYAPLADRIGMNSIKWELEDISLRYINPDAYYDIVKSMDARRDQREAYINKTIEEIEVGLSDMHIEAEIYGRPKHIYSIYRKMTDQNKAFEDIYDLLAIRILVDTVRDCYAVLGAVHSKWKPITGRFKDYIAMPKANMYQSIHTTVIGPGGKPVEIQIRTHEMHEVAEYGVAAHWAYKQGHREKVESTQSDESIQKQLQWFKSLVELGDETDTASEFMDFVKDDLFKDQVYVFTPQGDVRELPTGAGPIDFAYDIHTEIGSKTVGAKVNGNIVPLDYTLKNGDIVEILTNPNAKPSRDWLKLTATSKARNRIKRYFKVKDIEKNSEIGREMLDRDIKKTGHSIKELSNKKIGPRLLERFNFAKLEDLYAAIGLNEISTQTILTFLGWREEDHVDETANKLASQNVSKVAKKPSRTVHESGVVVEGADNLMIRLSQCCNPVPGDDIVGYITRGRGISVHRTDCPNLKHEVDIQDRTIPVSWDTEQDAETKYAAEIRIIGFNRSGIVNDILHVIDHTIKNLLSVNARSTEDSQSIIDIKVGIDDTQQLADLMAKLRAIPDVYEVDRMIA